MEDVSVGRIVHYVAYGTPGGEFPSGVCRAAVVTEVRFEDVVGLCVLNPSGIFFNRDIRHDESNDESKLPGTWHWPERV